MHPRSVRSLVVASCLCLSLNGLADRVRGQIAPTAARNRRVVDQVLLDDGTQLRGIVLQTTADRVTLLVERAWLAQHNSAGLAQWSAEQWEQTQRIQARLDDRIERWIQARSENRLLVSFLRDEQERIRAIDMDALNGLKFIMVGLSADQVRKIEIQPDDRHRVAALAWQNDLPDVNQATLRQLQRLLKQRQIDMETTPIELVSEMPPQSQTDDQWAARIALVEYLYHEPLAYQGAGSRLYPADQPLNPQMALGLLGGNMADQIGALGRELGLPEFQQPAAGREDRADWFRTAVKAAETKDLTGVWISRLEPPAGRTQIQIDGHFFFRTTTGQWRELYQGVATIPLSQVTPQQVAALAANPQVEQAIRSVEQLGLPIDRSRIELAFRHGAAVQIGLSQVRDDFATFQNRFTTRLDTPTVPWKP